MDPCVQGKYVESCIIHWTPLLNIGWLISALQSARNINDNLIIVIWANVICLNHPEGGEKGH